LREEIRAGIRSHDVDINDRTIGVHMGRLRKALRLNRQFDPIRTVRGFGYAFKEEQNFSPGRAGKTQWGVICNVRRATTPPVRVEHDATNHAQRTISFRVLALKFSDVTRCRDAQKGSADGPPQ
jgi:hypothetical protein